MSEKKAYRIAILINFLLFLCLSHPIQVSANSGIQEIHEFDDLSGDAQYIGKQYRDNYSLDMEDTGILDVGKEMVNGFANALFDLVKTIAFITASVFYYSMEFDITQVFSKQLNGIQATLNSGLFKPLFPLLFGFTAFIILQRFIRRDLIGTIQEVGKVVLLVVLSFMVVSRSADVLSAATSLTKELGVSIVNGVNNDKKVTNTKSYAATVAGVLWSNLVHEPWKSFQFNENVDNATVHNFLTTTPGSKKRENLVEQYMDDHPNSNCFNKKSCGWRRIPAVFLYLIIMIVKCIIYVLVAAIQLAFQVMAILFMLLAPVVLILAMMPGYEMTIVTSWLRKLFETQLSILIVTFILALLVKFDSILYELIPSYGWYIVVILQTILMVAVIIGRKQILKGFVNIQKAASTPSHFGAQLRRSGNLYEKIERMSSRNRMSARNYNRRQSQNTPREKADRKEENSAPEVMRPRTQSDSKVENEPATSASSAAETKIGGSYSVKRKERPNLMENEKSKGKVSTEALNPSGSDKKEKSQGKSHSENKTVSKPKIQAKAEPGAGAMRKPGERMSPGNKTNPEEVIRPEAGRVEQPERNSNNVKEVLNPSGSDKKEKSQGKAHSENKTVPKQKIQAQAESGAGAMRKPGERMSPDNKTNPEEVIRPMVRAEAGRVEQPERNSNDVKETLNPSGSDRKGKSQGKPGLENKTVPKRKIQAQEKSVVGVMRVSDERTPVGKIKNPEEVTRPRAVANEPTQVVKVEAGRVNAAPRVKQIVRREQGKREEIRREREVNIKNTRL